MNFARVLYRALLPSYARTLISRLRSRVVASVQKPQLTHALQPRPWRRYEGKSVAVVGLFSTRSGIGRGAELIARAIEMQGLPVIRFDIPWHGLENIKNTAVSVTECDKVGSAVSDLIVIANPPVFFHALSMFSIEWLRERAIVAHWAWELDVVDKNWRDAVKLCDEVWASSEFVAQTLKPLCDGRGVPLKVVPYPTDVDPFQPAEMSRRISARRKLNISDDTYILGYSFAISSNYQRKNPMGAVAAFQRAFPAEKEVGLVLRALDGHVYPKGMAELRLAANADPRVILVEHSSDLPIADFYAAIDLYISPARSEGYGLNIVEATQAGLPAVVTEWSLSRDVLSRPDVVSARYRLVSVVEDQGNYAGIKGAKWADPDINHMARKLRIARNRRQLGSGLTT